MWCTVSKQNHGSHSDVTDVVWTSPVDSCSKTNTLFYTLLQTVGTVTTIKHESRDIIPGQGVPSNSEPVSAAALCGLRFFPHCLHLCSLSIHVSFPCHLRPFERALSFSRIPLCCVSAGLRCIYALSERHINESFSLVNSLCPVLVAWPSQLAAFG